MTAPVDRAAEVLALHRPRPEGCRCGWKYGSPVLALWQDHVAGVLRDADLLAPPPHRTFRAGDPEPDGVQAVLTPYGNVLRAWVLDDGTTSWGLDELSWSWDDVPFPVTEVHLPGAPS